MDYFELRSADAQKQLLDDTVRAYTDNPQLAPNRFRGGRQEGKILHNAKYITASTSPAQRWHSCLGRGWYRTGFALL